MSHNYQLAKNQHEYEEFGERRDVVLLHALILEPVAAGLLETGRGPLRGSRPATGRWEGLGGPDLVRGPGFEDPS